MFRYEVEFWDEIDNIERKESGFVAAKRYGAAANKLVDYYGKDNISSITISEMLNPICDEEMLEGFKETKKDE